MNKSELKIAMLGMIPGNGHPWSWSAIVNGYDPQAMAKCPYEVIPKYLGAQDLASVRIDGFRVSHIWTDDPSEAPMVAEAARIDNVVEQPEEVIGQVDAVIIATDDGADHVRRAKPFIEAGLPVFIDKPLATTVEELRQFRQWHAGGARILSSSGLRYAKELPGLHGGEWLWMNALTAKTWERYGIHILEPTFVILGPGFEEVRCEHQPGADVVWLRHQCGTQLNLAAMTEAVGASGVFNAYGKGEHRAIRTKDTYSAFRGQLLAVTKWFRDGRDPYPFAHTEELMAVVIGGIRSRENGGVKIKISDILEETQP